MKHLKQIKLLIILLLMIFTLTGCTLEINTNSENTITIHTNTTNTAQNIVSPQKEDNKQNVEVETCSTFDLSKIPSYKENPYVIVNDNLDSCVMKTLEIIKIEHERQQMIDKLISEI